MQKTRHRVVDVGGGGDKRSFTGRPNDFASSPAVTAKVAAAPEITSWLRAPAAVAPRLQSSKANLRQQAVDTLN